MTDKSIAQVLRDAADLIEPEGKWTQSQFARRSDGHLTGADSSDAVCWCLAGAVLRNRHELEDVGKAYAVLELLTGGMMAWNDAPDRTQADVVAKLRQAAALAEEQAL